MTLLKMPALAMTAGLFALLACTDINTPTGNANTRTNEGIGVGAATGALWRADDSVMVWPFYSTAP